MSTLLLPACFLALSATPADPPSFEEVEQNTLAARIAVRSGDVLYETWREPGGLRPPDARSLFTRLTFDGDRVREEVGTSVRDGGLIVPSEQRVFNPEGDYRIAYYGPAFLPDIGPNPGFPYTTAVTAGRMSTYVESPGRRHARQFGFTAMPFDALHDEPLDSFVGYEPSADREIEAVAGPDGETHYRLSCTWVDRDAEAFYEVDPARGWSVVRLGVTLEQAGRVRTYGVENELEQFDGVWYPREVVYSVSAGGQLLGNVRTRVLEATLDQPVPADTFGPESFRVPPGSELIVMGDVPVPAGEFTQIGFIRTGSVGVEPGSEVEPGREDAAEGAADDLPPAAAPEPPGDPVSLWAAVGAAACCGAFWVRRARRRV